MKLFTILTFSLFMTACSVYKSQGRQQFESDSPGKIRTYSLLNCQKQNSISAWFQSEFPNKSYELVLSEPELEIWKSGNADGSIAVRAVQINGPQQIACNYQFANESVWRSYQKQFIDELENNMMTAD